MVRFRNITEAELHVGSADGRLVEPDTVFEVDAALVDETDDAYVVGEPLPALPKKPTPKDLADQDRAASTWRSWPKTVWALDSAESPPPAGPQVGDTTEERA